MYKKRKIFSLSLIISLCFGVFTWIVFYPGVLSADSLYTYYEASTGSFSDVRPPLLTLILFILLKVGGNIGLLTFVECLLGFLGVRRLALALLKLFASRRAFQEIATSFIILLLSSPLTPMPIYFATFWFDSWLAIFLLWVSALLIEVAIEVPVAPSRIRPKVFLIILFITLVMLIRLNSTILYLPLILALSWVLFRLHLPLKKLIMVLLSPIIFYFLFLFFQYNILEVRKVHTERVPFALDLASMLTYDPTICKNLSLPSCQIVLEEFPPEFVVGKGAIDRTMNQGLGRSDPGFIDLVMSPYLSEDLLLAATNYPLTYGIVKGLNFLDYISPRDQYYYQSFMHPNNLNLKFNSHFEFVRNTLFRVLHTVYKHPILKLFSFVHFPWIVLNLFGIFYYLKSGQNAVVQKLLGLVLLTPGLYYFSYLLALTASEFRYMYPSTLLIQVIFLAFMLRKLISGKQRELWTNAS